LTALRKGGFMMIGLAATFFAGIRYAGAQDAAQRSGAPLVTVRGGGPARGAACMAFTRQPRADAMPSRIDASASGAVTFGLWLASMSMAFQPFSLLARSRNWRKTSPGRETLQ